MLLSDFGPGFEGRYYGGSEVENNLSNCGPVGISQCVGNQVGLILGSSLVSGTESEGILVEVFESSLVDLNVVSFPSL